MQIQKFSPCLKIFTILTFNMLLVSQSLAFNWGGNGTYEKITDPSKASPQPPAAPSCVIKVSNTITVKGTLDGKGCLYQWVGKYANICHHTSSSSNSSDGIPEGAPRMFIMAPGSKIKNLQMDCSPDGILMNDNTTIDNIVNRDCGDDCITTRGTNNTIKNSQFYFCQNKCIQLNKATNVVIDNNDFFHAWRPMSGTNSAGAARPITATNNYCYNCDIEFLLFEDHEVTAQGNVLEKGNCMFETQDQSVVYDAGGNTATKGAAIRCPHGNHNVKPK